MPRKYTVSPAVLERNAKGREAASSPESLIARIERAKARLTPEHIARLSALLASAPPREESP